MNGTPVTNADRTFHILHVVSRLPVGGVENMLLKVIRGYDPNRFRVSVCCIKEGGAIADELKGLGYPVYVLGRMRGKGFDPGAVAALRDLMRREKVVILRTHQFHANLYGRIAGMMARVPVIIPSFHSLYRSPESPKFHRRVLNHLLGRFSDRLVAVSSAVAADLLEYDRIDSGKIVVVHNGIALEKFRAGLPKEEARKRFSLPGNAFIAGAVGRLKEEKGHAYLIEAAAGMRDIVVAIAGDGPLRRQLGELCGRNRVRCVFTGMLGPDDIPSFLASLDVFCFPSLWEGMPSALIEAMAAGLPVIATDIASNREVLGDAGLLVPPRDAEAVRNGLGMLLNEPTVGAELAQKAGERADLFSIRNTVKKYEDLFDEILRAKGLI